MDAKKVYLTKEGIAELKKEYQELNSDKRPKVLERMTQARSMGDLSENGEYTAAREELSFIDGRIDELEELLKQAVLIDEVKKTSKSVIGMGSTVTVKTNGKEEVFMVVGEWEADPANKKISHESPLGKALLEKKVGETVEVEAPAGKITYTILSIG